MLYDWRTPPLSQGPIMKTHACLAFLCSTLLFLTGVVAGEDYRMRAEAVAPGVYAVATPSPDALAALAPFAGRFPGLEEKARRDLSHVYLQVEQEMFE